VALVLAMLVAAVSTTDSGIGGRGTDPLAAPRLVLYGGVAEYAGMEGSDRRFDEGTRAQAASAAREWWRVNAVVLRRMRAAAWPDQVVDGVLGSCRVFNAATLELAGRLESWDDPAPITGARVRDGEATLERELAPSVGGRRRVLAVIDSSCTPYPGDETGPVLAVARSRGWSEREAIRLPNGDRVAIWVAAPSGG
jgi:hypothetical protein